MRPLSHSVHGWQRPQTPIPQGSFEPSRVDEQINRYDARRAWSKEAARMTGVKAPAVQSPARGGFSLAITSGHTPWLSSGCLLLHALVCVRFTFLGSGR
eukprot:jgi/Chrzof1/3152/Cz12g13220.t1